MRDLLILEGTAVIGMGGARALYWAYRNGTIADIHLFLLGLAGILFGLGINVMVEGAQDIDHFIIGLPIFGVLSLPLPALALPVAKFAAMVAGLIVFPMMMAIVWAL